MQNFVSRPTKNYNCLWQDNSLRQAQTVSLQDNMIEINAKSTNHRALWYQKTQMPSNTHHWISRKFWLYIARWRYWRLTDSSVVSPKYPIWSPCLLHGFHPAVVSCCNKILPDQAIDTFAAVWLLHFLFLKNVTSAILFLNWLNLILWTSWFFSSARTKSNDEIMEFGKSSDVGDFDALMPIELNNRTEIRFTLDHVFTYLPTVGF